MKKILLYVIRLIYLFYSVEKSQRLYQKFSNVRSRWYLMSFPKENLGYGVAFSKISELRGTKYIHIGNRTYFNYGIFITAISQYNTELKRQNFSPVLSIGEKCNFGAYNHITCINEIRIGHGVLTGKFVTITDNCHGDTTTITDVLLAYQNLTSKGPVHIGNNVWIGEKVTILPGVTIGDGAVIGANSVVSKDIPAHSIACGIPAKVIKTKYKK